MADICSDIAARRVPRKWLRAVLVSLLAALLTAGAYWYVTGVHVTDDPYVDVGESAVSTDISGIAKNIDAACPSSPCVRSPRSRLPPKRSSADRRAARTISTWRLSTFIWGRPMSVDLNDDWLILLSDVASRLLISYAPTTRRLRWASFDLR